MKIIGIHHIKFTVTLLERSKEFYQKFPGFHLVADYKDFAMFSCGAFYLGLTTHQKAATGVFNEENVGMDHIAFEVATKEDLEEAVSFLDTNHIPHNGIEKLSNDTYLLVFRDPDNIQLEFSYRKKK